MEEQSSLDNLAGGLNICREMRSSGKHGKLKRLGNLAKTNGLRKASGGHGEDCQTDCIKSLGFSGF